MTILEIGELEVVSQWTPERIEQVKTLAEKGMSARLIADELGASRNAVVGVGFRNGIQFKAIIKQKRSNSKQAVKPIVNIPVIEVVPEPQRVGMLTIMELDASACRFPFGDPRDTSFRYCGQRKSLSGSYCNSCRSIAYETPEQRRARLR